MKTLADFGTLNAAEAKLLAACVSGDGAEISLTRPEQPIADGENANVVRATLIRWLALGGNNENKLHEHGVQLAGAWITDQLDLVGATINAGLVFGYCNFETRPTMIGVHLNGTLSFHGSRLQKGLDADGAKITGSVLFRDGFESDGEVRFLGALIGGDLECNDAKFQVHKERYAIRADGAIFEGNVFLNKSEFSGTLRLTAAKIKGVLELNSNTQPFDCVDVSHCQVSVLQSEMTAWGEHVVLDGFECDALRYANWRTVDYIIWLKKQSVSHYGTKESPHQFKPQPWQHLIAVLRKMGHNDTANDIAIAFEQRRYAIKSHWGKVKGCLHPLFGWLAGYGYKPMRLVGWMVGVWLACSMLYWHAAYQGVFAPSDPLVFQNKDYDNCRPVDKDSTPRPIDNNNKDQITYNWYTCGALVGEYNTFSPMAFSLDVILPLVDLGQEKTWGTYIDTAKPSMGAELLQFSHNHWIRLLIWFEVLFGWMASLMLVAVLTGLTDRTKQQ